MNIIFTGLCTVVLIVQIGMQHLNIDRKIERILEEKMIVCNPPSKKGSTHCYFEDATKYKIN